MAVTIRNLAALLIAISLGGQTLFGDEREEFRSYLELHKSNWSAIEKMDVLIRTDTLAEPGYHPGYTETTYERIALDWANDRFLFVRTAEKKPITDGVAAETTEAGFVIRNGQYRTFRNGIYNGKARELENRSELFDKLRVPDLRLSMFMKLGRDNPRTWTQNKFNSFDIYPQTATQVRIVSTEGESIGLEADFKNRAGFRWKFDKETSMPIETRWTMDQGAGLKPLLLGRETLDWKEFDGIYVPERIVGDFQDRQARITPEKMQEMLLALAPEQRNVDGIQAVVDKAYIVAIQNRDLRFHWNSINKEIPMELFDLNQIDKPASFVGLADPSQVGASELLSDPK